MPIFSVLQAKTQLSKFLAQVRQGEEVIIAKGKEPVARIVPFVSKGRRHPGRLNGRVALTPAFFEPLPTDGISAWSDD